MIWKECIKNIKDKFEMNAVLGSILALGYYRKETENQIRRRLKLMAYLRCHHSHIRRRKIISFADMVCLLCISSLIKIGQLTLLTPRCFVFPIINFYF